MSEEPEPLEDIAASLLNSAMVCLLSAAFPALLAWQAVARWETWTADIRSLPVWLALNGVLLLLASIRFMAVGGQAFWRNLKALRQRHRSSSTA